ncbi:hypothetical protein EGH21_11060 [Halomicroarcula sp. F13]|uniref:Uncharacterized protein n=1 Tax=Haloarcula rubra TaxID=2487747 RepID=A0AAW4PR03_9EURY|nr:hypothetical protein [Halomicroarcula rubra]MBX0323567.1 hypothetical protein [Halomicroarcula rubra]
MCEPDAVRETHVDASGLFIPSDVREFRGQNVFRTPWATIQYVGSEPLEAYYGLIDASHFGDVDIEPAVRCDG